LIEQAFLAYNGARLREGAQLLTERMLEDDVTVALSMTGALTPAGLGMSAVIPLMEAGFVDWIVSTGANLYHDVHFGIGLSMHRGTWQADDVELREHGVVRIYDIFFDYKVLLDTDAFFREVIVAPEFQRTMSTAEFHFLCGKYVRAREQALGLERRSLLAAAWEFGVPIYTSSPGDSSIGMNVAAKALEGNKLLLDVNADVNETAAIVWDAKRKGGKSAVWILGGGSPKNFLLQTEPQIQEVLGIAEKGHDYFPRRHRCAARHRRTLRRHTGRGGVMGQDRSRPAARYDHLLLRYDHRAAAAHPLRARAPQAAHAQAPL
jgi:deoxyhypusine synthase